MIAWRHSFRLPVRITTVLQSSGARAWRMHWAQSRPITASPASTMKRRAGGQAHGHSPAPS